MPVTVVQPARRGGGRCKGPKYITPTTDKFRRTKEGGRLICQELRRLLQEEVRMFPHKAMINANGDTVRYSKCGEAKEIAMEVLMVKAPIFFSAFYVNIRRKLDYGHKVHSWLTKVTCPFWTFFLWNNFSWLFFYFFLGGDIIEE